ncbi:hypothetical protein [Plebeiibacterium marinum]|uniref:Uncharacterized protein n=1 Tax=Plebeiibacterium marinum TaxID=2992111 RepID=A0AAE3SIE3_9BACT|nr:hypothetical protein [Plebeiobacterium marinum]MCW3804620.1 hypothetical protein [Plebeiobacterium marinum]
MKRINQILSTGFVVLLLFLNVGLALTLNKGLHAHFLGNNQILIHFHNTAGPDQPHHGTDGCASANFVFSTTITYLNNAEGVVLKSLCYYLHKENITTTYRINYIPNYQYSCLRAPPVV